MGGGGGNCLGRSQGLYDGHGSRAAWVETAVLQLAYNKTMKKKSHRRILKGGRKTLKPLGVGIKLPGQQAPLLSALIKPHITITSVALESSFQLPTIYSDRGKSAKSAFCSQSHQIMSHPIQGSSSRTAVVFRRTVLH